MPRLMTKIGIMWPLGILVVQRIKPWIKTDTTVNLGRVITVVEAMGTVASIVEEVVLVMEVEAVIVLVINVE